ncbi:PspC domain-containing protein [Angustibacter luteus]|uniref:PspC domain-containing protein n=1 Tax=Angustibacter luteus TaxID=658456 RepID=A0ABW1JGK1_9ACTN
MDENQPHAEPQAEPQAAPPPPSGPTSSSTSDQILDQLRGLRRSTDDKVIAGVAGGLGRSLGIDPLLLRVVLAVLVLFGGSGIVLYALAWLLVPQDDGTPSVGQQALDRPRFRPSGSTVWLAIILVVAVSIGVVGAFSQWHGPVLLTLAVVALLVLLLRQDDRTSRAANAPAPEYAPAAAPTYAAAAAPTYAATAAPTYAAPTTAMPTAGAPVPPQPPTWAAPVPPPPPLPPRPPKPRSHLFGITFSLGLIALGVLGAADLYGADVPTGAYPALALGIVGLGLLVGAWFGRARGLIFWGILLVPVMLVATIAGEARSISHRAVDKNVVVTQVDQLPSDDRYGAGQVEYDLTGLDLTGQTASMGAQMGFGEIVVTVPRTMDVHLTSRVGVGGLTLFGQESGGVNERIVRVDNGPDGVGGGQLDLDLYAGFGHLEVRRATS